MPPFFVGLIAYTRLNAEGMPIKGWCILLYLLMLLLPLLEGNSLKQEGNYVFKRGIKFVRLLES